MSTQSLYNPVEQAGVLLKKGHSRHAWLERYFVLKGSFLFYFPNRKAGNVARKLHGVIPLESAKIETELPPSMADSHHREGHIITITLHSTHAFSCMHPFYVLCAPSADVQMAWVNALWQARAAAIPRADLIHHLSTSGKLADVLASYAQNVQNNFPVADASVLSTGGRARTAAVANVGSLAGMIRRHKGGAAPAVSDLKQLPVVASERSAPSHVLARTTSGNLVTAPSSSVLLAAAAESAMAPAASSASLASSGSKPVAGGAAAAAVAAAASDKPQPQPVVALTASSTAAGPPAAAKGSGSKDAEKQAAALEQMKVIEAQISRLEKESGGGGGGGGSPGHGKKH